MNRFCLLPLTLAVSAGLVGLGPKFARALPPDPQRAFEADNCAGARVRYSEALAGSPLISPEENADAVDQAAAEVARLCGQPSPATKKSHNRLNAVPAHCVPKKQMSCRL